MEWRFTKRKSGVYAFLVVKNGFVWGCEKNHPTHETKTLQVEKIRALSDVLDGFKPFAKHLEFQYSFRLVIHSQNAMSKLPIVSVRLHRGPRQDEKYPSLGYQYMKLYPAMSLLRMVNRSSCQFSPHFVRQLRNEKITQEKQVSNTLRIFEAI